MPKPVYHIRPVYPCDYGDVMRFMAETYYKSEPSIVNVGRLAGRPSPLMIHLMDKSLRQGLSLMAVDRCNCIVGAAVNVQLSPCDVESADELARCCECGPARDLVNFYSFCSRQADPWALYCVPSVFECAHVAVLPEHRGNGIARRLIADSWVLARDVGHVIFKIDCSSRYTSRIAETFSWRCIYSIPYRRYFDNGIFVFQCVQEPHTEMKVFADRISHKTFYPTIRGFSQ